MKFVNLALTAAIGLAASIAPAQLGIPMAYDTYSTATTVSYYTGPGNTCTGDLVSLVGLPAPIPPFTPAPPPYIMSPTDTFDAINVLFVATGPGTFNVDLAYYSGPLGAALPGICPPVGPITIPPGAFPSVWQVQFTFGTPVPIGNNGQAVVVTSDNAAFSTAYVNLAAAPLGSDVPANGFLVDINPTDCILTPSSEFVTFSNPGNWNLAMQIGMSPPLRPSQLTCGGSTTVTAVPRLDLTPVRQTMVTPSIRVNTKL